MKVSLWHLYERLLEFSPTANITKGLCEIEDVRVFSLSNHFYFPDYVYLVNVSPDYGWGVPQDSIILMHQNDMLILHNTTFYDALNKIMDIFDYFREIEGKLEEACKQANPYEPMLEILYDYYHLPIVIANNNLKVLAATEVVGAIVEGWDIIFKTQHMPITFFSVFNNDSNNHRFISCKKPFFMNPVNQNASQYYRKLLVIPFESEHTAGKVLINYFDDHFSPGDLQMGEIFAGYLSRIEDPSHKSHHIVSYFENALLNGYYSQEELRAICSMRHWKEESSFFLSIITPSNYKMALSELRWCCGILELNIPDAFAFVLNENIVVIMPRQNLPIEQVLKNVFNSYIVNYNFLCGVSLEMRGLNNLRSYYLQGQYALRKLKGAEKGIASFQSCGFQGMCAEISKSFDWRSFFPQELKALKDFDRTNKSDYYQTYYAYLQNDQHIQETAQQLHIHPNTLKYRLKKIFSILQTDQKDLEKRNYFLLCMQLEKNTENPIA